MTENENKGKSLEELMKDVAGQIIQLRKRLDKVEERYEIEDKKEKKEARKKMDSNITRSLGALASGGAFHYFLGDTARTGGKILTEIGNGALAFGRFASPPTDQELQKSYTKLNMGKNFQTSKKEYLIWKRAYNELRTLDIKLDTQEKWESKKDQLRTESRKILNFFGYKSKPQSANLKKEEIIRLRKKQKIADHYIKEMDWLQNTIKEHNEKVVENEYDGEGLQTLKELANEYIKRVKCRYDFKKISTIQTSKEYSSLKQQASNYRVTNLNTDIGGAATAFLMTLLAGYIGNRICKHVRIPFSKAYPLCKRNKNTRK